ncbi:hypothetical protein MMC25_000061 [Agyrium rufum]|nr:hypothetical protein [Agyrium rufum]
MTTLPPDSADLAEEVYSPDTIETIKRFYHVDEDLERTDDAKCIAEKLENYEANVLYVQEQWEGSPDQEKLRKFIKSTILPLDELEIDSALCLGLGPLDFDEYSEYFGTELFGEQEKFWADNFRFIQLIIFETVIDMLKERFDIKVVAFQDPKFGAADEAFLQDRGHQVIPYPASEVAKATHKHRFHLDPEIRQQFSSKTFLFCPRLEIQVLVDAVLAWKPMLYLGTDLFTYLNTTDLVWRKFSSAPLWPELERFVWSRNYEPIQTISYLIADPLPDQGIHWQIDHEDKAAVEEMRKRFLHRESRDEDSNKFLRQREERRKATKATPEQAIEMLETRRELLCIEAKFRKHWSRKADEEGTSQGGKASEGVGDSADEEESDSKDINDKEIKEEEEVRKDGDKDITQEHK